MDKYVELAKSAIESYVKNKKIMEVPENLPDNFYARQAGVFVTIHNDKDLRGCIGTYLPTKKNLAEEIMSNAVAACSQDFRFSPMTKDELPELYYEVSILSEPKVINNLANHDPKKHGIIVKCSDGRCGLLLPGLERVNTTDQQIEISCQKGGISPQSDKFQLWEFEVEKHS